MNRAAWLAMAAIMALMVSGCAAPEGDPADPGPAAPDPDPTTPRPGPGDEVRLAEEGDCVRFSYSVRDMQGVVLDAGTAWTLLGSGASGLDPDVEHIMVGLGANASASVTGFLSKPQDEVVLDAALIAGAEVGDPVRVPAAPDASRCAAHAAPGHYEVVGGGSDAVALAPLSGVLAPEAYGAERTVLLRLLEVRNGTADAAAPVPLGQHVEAMACVVLGFYAYAPETGGLRGEGTVFWQVGREGSTGLGSEVESLAVDRSIGEAFRVVSGDDAGGRAAEESVRTLDRLWVEADLVQSWTREFFDEFMVMWHFWIDLDNATEGDYVHLHDIYDGYYVSHNETHVTVRFDPPHGQVRPLSPTLPIDYEVHVDEDAGTWTEFLHPRGVGERFSIDAAPDYSCRTDFDFPPGQYLMEEPDEERLHMRLVEPEWGLEGPAVFHVELERLHWSPFR